MYNRILLIVNPGKSNIKEILDWMDALHQLEIVIILFLQSLGAWTAAPMRLISMLGTEDFFILVMPSLYWCLDAALGLRVAVMLLLSNAINCVGKLAFHSPRPYWISTQVKGYSVETSFGIPSGHAQNSASIWGTIAAWRRLRWEKAVLSGIIFLVGLSRIFLGMHFISDVLAGWLIGGLMVALLVRYEKPVAAWLRCRTLPQMLGLALVSTVLLIGIVVLPTLALSSWQMPPEWATNALISQPDDPIDPLNLDGTFTLSGTWLGMWAGLAWLFHRQGLFNASGAPTQRLLRYVVGIAGILVLWFGLGQVFPRSPDQLSYSLRLFRYTLIGFWIAAGAPLLFQRLGLASSQKTLIVTANTPYPQ